MVVGDDAQSIYSFRAATVRNILDFPTHFEPPARIVTLEQNYRSTQAILAASNAVIGLASERYAKNLWSERASAQRPALVHVPGRGGPGALCLRARARTPRSGGCRSSRRRCCSRVGSQRPARGRADGPQYSVREVRRIEIPRRRACERRTRGPAFRRKPARPRRGFRVMQLLPGIGPVTARPRARRGGGRGCRRGPCARSRRARAPRRTGPPSPSSSRNCVREKRAGRRTSIAYASGTNRICCANSTTRRCASPTWSSLAHIASSYASRAHFLTELTLDPPDAASDESGVPSRDEDYLILSTIHSAKGQEWNAVFVLNGVDGCIPSDLATGSTDEIEEERRPALRRDDAREGRTRDRRAAALLRHAAIRPGRSSCVRLADTLHSERAAAAIRLEQLAARGGRAADLARAGPRAYRSRRADAQDVGLSVPAPASPKGLHSGLCRRPGGLACPHHGTRFDSPGPRRTDPPARCAHGRRPRPTVRVSCCGS